MSTLMPHEISIFSPLAYRNPDGSPPISSATALFREGCHLTESLQYVYQNNPGNSPLNFIVAACSNGAQAYSLIALHNHMAEGRQINLVGYDISPHAIEAARLGIFRMAESRPKVAAVARSRLAKYGFRVLQQDQIGHVDVDASPLTQGHQVSFKEADLCVEVPYDKKADLVMANNILYHLKTEKADRLLDNLVRLLADRGVLSIGGVRRYENRQMGQVGELSSVTYLEWLQAKTEVLDSQYGLKPVLKDDKGEPVIFSRY